jgi:uncharacterized protein (TIGR02757 family)
MMPKDELIDFLNFKSDQYENIDFLQSDPIQLPHQFKQKEDIELVGLLVSTIAWGNRKSIIKSGENLLEIMENEPYNFVTNYTSDQLRQSKFVHRTFNVHDLDFFFRGLRRIYENGGLETAFGAHPSIEGIKGRIIQFRTSMLLTTHEMRSVKHISDPLRNSAAKRLNMFLRWMVRDAKKGVDFGIWKSISSSELYLPLDVHTSTNARKLELLHRKQDDWKALEELMTGLREFDPADPVKYDFALFGLGAFEKF